jgi:hypothetical protein
LADEVLKIGHTLRPLIGYSATLVTLWDATFWPKGRKINTLIEWPKGGGTACSHYQRASYFYNNNNDHHHHHHHGLFTYLLSCLLDLLLLVINNIY